MKIVKYNSTADIVVEFQDDYKYTTHMTYSNFKRGFVSNPYDKTMAGVGYTGDGMYKTKINNVNTVSYQNWKDQIERCYLDKKKEKYKAYYGICTVCDEWLNYQNYASWYEENFYSIKGERVHLDKDILVKDNKIYSPDTCIFVPQRINMIFMTKSRNTDCDLPTGIRRTPRGFNATYNTKYLGVFSNLEEAVKIYNIEKRIHIKQVAEEYRDRIPDKVYNALINW